MADESEVTLELEIEELLDDGIRRQNRMHSENRERGYHISGLGNECMRAIQYGRLADAEDTPKVDESAEEVTDGTYRAWIGTQLHLTPLTPKHEWGVYHVFEVNGKKVKVHGHIDEIYERADGSEVIIDKKFVASVPYTANEHHKKQISYYAALMSRQGAAYNTGAVFYFSPIVAKGSPLPRKRVFTFPIDADAAFTELEQRVRTVQEAVDSGTLLPRSTHWYCMFCPGRAECIKADGPIFWKGKELAP